MQGRDCSKTTIAAPFVVLLAGMMLLCAGALSFLIFDAIKRDIATSEAEDPRMCLAIKDNTERLSCLETRVGKDPPSPARGAKVPANIFNSSKQ